MMRTNTMALVCFTLAAVSAKSIVEKNATVGDSVEFSASVNCTDDKEFKLMTEDISVTVAARVNGVWIPGKDYKDRIEHLSPSSLKLTGVTLTDNTLKGMYEFMCDKNPVAYIYLKVSTPSNRTETEGETGEINLNQTTLRPPPVNSTQGPVEDKGMEPRTIAAIVVVLSVLAFIFCLGLYLYLKSCRSKVPPGPGDGRATDVEMRPLNGGVSAGPQVNGGPPVPNSNGC